MGFPCQRPVLGSPGLPAVSRCCDNPQPRPWGQRAFSVPYGQVGLHSRLVLTEVRQVVPLLVLACALPACRSGWVSKLWGAVGLPAAGVLCGEQHTDAQSQGEDCHACLFSEWCCYVTAHDAACCPAKPCSACLQPGEDRPGASVLQGREGAALQGGTGTHFPGSCLVPAQHLWKGREIFICWFTPKCKGLQAEPGGPREGTQLLEPSWAHDRGKLGCKQPGLHLHGVRMTEG